MVILPRVLIPINGYVYTIEPGMGYSYREGHAPPDKKSVGYVIGITNNDMNELIYIVKMIDGRTLNLHPAYVSHIQ